VHGFSWSAACEKAGLARDASYLVRPDGYVALADPLHSAERLDRYLHDRSLRFLGAPERTPLHPGAVDQHP
jgi:hypothetical protein